MFKLLLAGIQICLIFNANLPALANSPNDAQIELGRKIYQYNQHMNGQPISGSQQSCVSCHRNSGLGGVEGNNMIPPITGEALFGEGQSVIVKVEQRFNTRLSVKHNAYDDKTFADALKDGRHVSGRLLDPLMPRYSLSSEETKALITYLRTLSASQSAGVSNKEVRIATVLTPNIDLLRQKAFLTTLEALVNHHNANVISGQRQKISAIERHVQNRRKWILQTWQLSGPSETWKKQLVQKQQQDPVFAVLSGLSDSTWQPVQDFCEENRVVCWFPSTDIVPENAAKSAFSVYFSKGIQLEVEAMAEHILKTEPSAINIVQITGNDVKAESAALATTQQFKKSGFSVSTLSISDISNISEILRHLTAKDKIILWLRRDELERLTRSISAPLTTVFYSETFAGDETISFPENWKENIWMVQRYELPVMRSLNLVRFREWIKYRNIAVVDEKMQSEVFFAANSFAETLSSMLNNLYPDYMIERAEDTLSMRESIQVQEEVQATMMGGSGRRPQAVNLVSEVAVRDPITEKLMMKRESTSSYPRLSLGIGQRFASKGAYLIKIKNGGDPEWIIP